MTESMVTTAPDATVQEIAELMRERNINSMMLVKNNKPVEFLTDHDLTISILATGRTNSDPTREFTSAPVITTEPNLTTEKTNELMVRHSVHRLVIMSNDELADVVTLDNLTTSELTSELSARITRAALPDFYFHAHGN